MIVEDQREVIRARPEGQQSGVIDAGTAVHQQQRITVSDDFYEE
jgi:hypothetical protein